MLNYVVDKKTLLVGLLGVENRVLLLERLVVQNTILLHEVRLRRRARNLHHGDGCVDLQKETLTQGGAKGKPARAQSTKRRYNLNL